MVATGVALLAAFYVRFSEPGVRSPRRALLGLVPAFCSSPASLPDLGTYRSAWRFTSLPDLLELVKATTVLAVTLLVADYILVAPNAYGGFFLGKKTIAIYWVLQIFFLGGCADRLPVLPSCQTAGGAANAAAAPRWSSAAPRGRGPAARYESGAVQRLRVVGVLSPADGDQQQSVRGVRVVGRPADLEAVVRGSRRAERRSGGSSSPRLPSPPTRPDAVLAWPAASPSRPAACLRSTRAGLGGWRRSPRRTSCCGPGIRRRPQASRPSIRGRSVARHRRRRLDRQRICRAWRRPRRGALMIVEHSEPALTRHPRKSPAADFSGDLPAISATSATANGCPSLFGEFRPDVVFHAAALKHVRCSRRLGRGREDQRVGSVNRQRCGGRARGHGGGDHLDRQGGRTRYRSSA